ncbi:MAG: RNA polymerase sigma factor [Candidatus Limnocylindria bacterium]
MRTGGDDRPERAREDELVERAKKGDVEAYGEIVVRYQALAQRTAYVITRDAAAAEDAAQEAFVKAYRALGRFRPGAPLRPWLLRIVANEALNRAKAASRHRSVDLALAESRASDSEASPEAQALAGERREMLLRAVNALREEDRVVIAYRYFFDLSEAEMAEALGVARGTVKSRLSRAMARLRERFGG